MPALTDKSPARFILRAQPLRRYISTYYFLNTAHINPNRKISCIQSGQPFTRKACWSIASAVVGSRAFKKARGLHSPANPARRPRSE
jgi:hypothetical protein